MSGYFSEAVDPTCDHRTIGIRPYKERSISQHRRKRAVGYSIDNHPTFNPIIIHTSNRKPTDTGRADNVRKWAFNKLETETMYCTTKLVCTKLRVPKYPHIRVFSSFSIRSSFSSNSTTVFHSCEGSVRRGQYASSLYNATASSISGITVKCKEFDYSTKIPESIP